MRERVLWQRINKQEEDDMAGVAPELSGNASEADLNPRQEAAVRRAIRELQSVSDHIGIDGALGRLEGLIGEDETEIEKALRDVRGARVRLAKSASASSTVGLDAAERL